ncbi:MAG: hypothetical protein V7K88_13500 [Nostoc sp.]|uniref:hypothetical protein n=1 Tax=Nostoc sp. TaxID=1180 RepID=UPI002FF4B6BA
MNIKNGTTENAGGRRKNSQRENESAGLGKHGEVSTGYGLNPVGIASVDSSRKDTAWSDSRRSGNPGKILKRLELIEKTFLSYIQGDKYRLETRLEEINDVESAFKEEVQALKEEINHCIPDAVEEMK